MTMTKITTGQINGLRTIYARDYGAVEGADNTAAIILAVAAIVNGEGTRLVIPESLFTGAITIDKSNVVIDCAMAKMTYSASYVIPYSSAGPDWWYSPVIFAVTADNVRITNTRFFQGSYTYTGTFIWVNPSVNGACIDHCEFNDIPYLTVVPGVGGNINGVAIQIRTGSIHCKVTECTFNNCTGAISMQCVGGVIDNCSAYVTSAQVTASVGVSDQQFGIDGSTGCSITNCKVIRGPGAPYAGANIGANSGSTNFVIANNYIQGVTAGVGVYVRGSSYGNVTGNVISSSDYAAVGAWAHIRVDADSSQITLSNNTMKSPPASGSLGHALQISPSGHLVSNNNFALGSSNSVYAAIYITPATGAGSLQVDNNLITTSQRGVFFYAITDNDLIPMVFRGNVYTGAQTTPLAQDGTMRMNCPVYLYDEQYVGASILKGTFNVGKFQRSFSISSAYLWPMAIGKQVTMYGGEIPANSSTWVGGTWRAGDRIYNSAPAVGSAIGWICTVGGTFSAASEAGTSTSGSAVITGLADTSDFFPGDYVNATAGFAVLTGLTIVSIVANTSITVDRAANATGACTLSTPDSIWVAMANL